MSRIKRFEKNTAEQTVIKHYQQEKVSADLSQDSSNGKSYLQFDQLNGSHPWMSLMPEGHISYKARILKNGKVSYFNFQLAKEMGLIPKNHSHKLNKALEQKLIDTFSLRIINEYDLENNLSVPKSRIIDSEFMATRYLQLQHSDKTGSTSGDGRCIWNGTVENDSHLWDVSSRGTGVTALAPGSVQAEEPLQSGNTDHGYGCGLAELDELYASAIMSEIMHNNGYNTERVLCIIDHGGGYGVGVRAAKNLMRPAHLFMFLKQNNFEALKRATDYLILRQIKNKEWSFPVNSPKRYDHMLEELCESFAKFSAKLERDYIFAWLDWDGDNVLANAGIIDYGSIRQFGLRYDQYRYDDIDRFSTNLNEQKNKARLMIQVFAQIVDYLKSSGSEKKPLALYKKHKVLKKFDKFFDKHKTLYFLRQLGLSKLGAEKIYEKHTASIQLTFRTFEDLEKMKALKKLNPVADGVNNLPLFNMRKALLFFSKLFLNSEPVSDKEAVIQQIYSQILVEEVPDHKKTLSQKISKKLLKLHQGLAQIYKWAQDEGENAKEMQSRCFQGNREDRVTGNALIHIVNEILDERKKGLKRASLQQLIDCCIIEQSQEKLRPRHRDFKEKKAEKLFSRVLSIIDGHKEDI